MTKKIFFFFIPPHNDFSGQILLIFGFYQKTAKILNPKIHTLMYISMHFKQFH